MTEYEVLEIVNLYASNAMNSFSIWATFTFAYLTAAYLAGARLLKLLPSLTLSTPVTTIRPSRYTPCLSHKPHTSEAHWR